MNKQMRLLVGLVTVVLLVGAFLVIAVGGGPVASNKTRQLVCGWSGGKWASSTDACVTRGCYTHNTCGTWAQPDRWCNRLQLGSSVAEVYFQLGEPSRVENDKYEWFGKGNFSESPNVAATITGGKLVSLRCK